MALDHKTRSGPKLSKTKAKLEHKSPKPAKIELPQPFKLPVFIGSPADLGRLARQLESLDEAWLQHGLRRQSQPPKPPRPPKLPTSPQASQLLDQTAKLNNLNLSRQADRQRLERFLADTKAQAPVLGVSFSAEPTAAFMEKLVSWLRQQIHPQVLVTVGLQPTLGVGCVVRSTNKYFDFSLRQAFTKNKQLLVDEILPPKAGQRA